MAIIVAIIALFFPLVLSTNFQIPQFDSNQTSVLLIGDAQVILGQIQLTDPLYTSRVAYVLYSEKVPIWDSNSLTLTDFTTHFSFVIDSLGRPISTYGHGIAFFLAPTPFQMPSNANGAFMGLFNTTLSGSSTTQILSVEFDTHSDGWDPPYQHVGINNNSYISSVWAPWNATLHSGEPGDVWITYDSSTKNLSVFWSYGGNPNSSLSYQIDLREVLPPWVTVGFSAATGSLQELNRLQSWEFNSTLDINEGGRSGSRKTAIIAGIVIAGVLSIIGGGSIALAIISKRWQNKNKTSETDHLTLMNDDLERGTGPRKFCYKDLATATSNFSVERKLGQGGFGGVYKGYRVDQDIPIAVKKFSSGSKQGKKEYITEIKVISRLRHKNLVQLIGWCHEQGEFLLVYEFMPNGSLDAHLFGKKNALEWSSRYKITRGLASSILYLHEEWEQCVIHRDIKPSNIMLDSNFIAKLGDFGLARLVDHELGLQTTGLAGTSGYLAPECISTGKSSKESDVYSFGVVALQIATGKKLGYLPEASSHTGLIEWVWDLYGSGEVLSAADGRLNMEFEPKEVERLLIVGLWCAHPDRSLRPSIRQAIQVLHFEATLPRLPLKMPVPVYDAPITSPLSSEDQSITHTINEIGR
ncbi:hypothetical protein LIER_37324 [Lithospermum erythrorhizon]|uniref:non-specific serine/threonine protein kinase n=1 Tax=Lithospermum erythrorhizon TaxID=34254 RepID=A0AAV3PMV0_LITER